VQRIFESRLDNPGDLTRLPQRVVVHLAHRHQLGGGPGEEHLVGQVELRACNRALLDPVAEVAGDLHHRVAGDAIEDRRGVRRRAEHPVSDKEDVLARALRDTAVLVEEDRLVVAGVRRLGLGQNRVQVLAGGLRVGDQAVARDRPPRGDLGPDAVPLAVLAEVGAPRPDRDDHLDRRVLCIEPHLAIATKRERPDVAGPQSVAPDQFVRRLAQLVGRVGQLEVVELGRLRQPLEVVAVPKDSRAALGLIAADPLEDAGAVVQSMAEHVDLGISPRH